MNKKEIEKAKELLNDRFEFATKHYKEQCMQAYTNALELAVKALEEQLNGGWIPCKTKQPDETGYYQTTVKYNKNINKGHTQVEKILFANEDLGVEPSEWIDEFRMYREVIAWQPLPPKYEEVSE